MADDAYKKAFERERLARKEAERITELKSRELFELNSALKELNAELEQRILDRTAQLEEAKLRAEADTRAKSEFLSVMSHEMRSPLNVIVGFADLLAQKELEGVEGGYVRNLRFSALQLLNLINDILDLSAIEAGKVAFDNTPFDVVLNVEKVFQAMEQRAVDKGLTWSHSLPTALPSPLRGDAAKLNQVLINLLDNAIKFTSQGGVSLNVSHMENKGNEGEVWVCLEVQDTGKGISEENLERIFQKFEQENTSTRRLHGGTGLGLAISKQLITMQGGSITCSSDLGKGTTFRVELPFAHEQRAGEAEVETPVVVQSLSGLRVLVVEDLEVNRMLLRHMLRDSGVKILEAAHGIEALEVLGAEEVDLVLMDLHMPEMDGIEATKEIRKGAVKGGDPELPIVCLTADVFKETREAIFSAGMNDFVTKPMDMHRLHQVLGHWQRHIGARRTSQP